MHDLRLALVADTQCQLCQIRCTPPPPKKKKIIHHLAIQNAAKRLATKNRLQQFLSNCSRSVVKKDTP